GGCSKGIGETNRPVSRTTHRNRSRQPHGDGLWLGDVFPWLCLSRDLLPSTAAQRRHDILDVCQKAFEEQTRGHARLDERHLRSEVRGHAREQCDPVTATRAHLPQPPAVAPRWLMNRCPRSEE